ncbi:MAG: hypothetical protein S4CHLAM123_07460 [Chlamydiales bacterium]|nr:hypothetical protein [Chlamydiales bacterium]
MRVIHWIALLLVIIGALNWGMVGFFQVNVINAIFGGSSAAISRIIYALVGLAGIWCIYLFRLIASCNLKK